MVGQKQVPVSKSSAEPPGEDRFFANGQLTVWWDRDELPGTSTVSLTDAHPSNIHPQDYAGAEACRKCHEKNYDAWSNHSHRWMNTLASTDTVKGRFDGSEISYLGGTAKFVKTDNGNFQMNLTRGSVSREYHISQTIGWRFFQYYVGTLKSGPEPQKHPAYHIDQVLPFGFWLDREEWVPVVHVGTDEAPDGRRDDPFSRDAPSTTLSPYFQCNSCHTTFALGDELTRNFYALGRHIPYRLHWSMPDYLHETRGQMLPQVSPREVPNAQVEQLLIGMQQFHAPDHAVTLGISCEACHLGCQEHVNGKQEKPSFFPISPHLNAETEKLATGRQHQNVNWACGRCHAGERPYFAAGMSTWNSTEYTDATKGSCYSQLRCIDCHSPHDGIGQQWSRTPEQDQESCLRCHEQFRADEALVQHTHHAADSEGSRCMNCHMPRLNEGLQDVVRTHAIFSPTQADMIESNQLNACNICHVEQPIDWTLTHLKQWYDATFSEEKIAENYPGRKKATAIGWLNSPLEAVRLSATDAIARSNDRTTLPALIDTLNDPYLLNRQFARIAIEKRFDIHLEDFGYQFFMQPDERREPIESIRQELLNKPQSVAAK